MQDTAGLQHLLDTITAAWTAGQTEALHQLFHPDMVIEGPHHQLYVSGREACVESYREFCEKARVLSYSATPPIIRQWGDTAVCTYSWIMNWQRDGALVSDAGTDQFVCARHDGRWLAVYRMVQFRT
jgi:alpha-D-ribose 1-methylphosphonate 5-phosphate C-P lyase